MTKSSVKKQNFKKNKVKIYKLQGRIKVKKFTSLKG